MTLASDLSAVQVNDVDAGRERPALVLRHGECIQVDIVLESDKRNGGERELSGFQIDVGGWAQGLVSALTIGFLFASVFLSTENRVK